MRLTDGDRYFSTTGTIRGGTGGRTVLTAIIPTINDRSKTDTSAYTIKNLPFPEETDVNFAVRHLQMAPAKYPSLPPMSWIDLEVNDTKNEEENARLVPALESLLSAQLEAHGPTHLERISLAFGSNYTAAQMIHAVDVVTKSGFAPRTVGMSRSQRLSTPVLRALTLDTKAPRGLSCRRSAADPKTRMISGSLPPYSRTEFHLSGLKLPEFEKHLYDVQKKAQPDSGYSYIASCGEEAEQFSEALQSMVASETGTAAPMGTEGSE